MISAATASVSAATTATRSVRRTLLASSATAFLNNSSIPTTASYSSSTTRTQSEGELKHGLEAGGSSSSSGERIKYFKVYRWDPEIENQKPYLSTYPVDLDDCGPMVRLFLLYYYTVYYAICGCLLVCVSVMMVVFAVIDVVLRRRASILLASICFQFNSSLLPHTRLPFFCSYSILAFASSSSSSSTHSTTTRSWMPY